MMRRVRAHFPSSFIAVVLIGFAARAAAVAIDAALVPEASSVVVGTEFEVRLHVTNPGVEFNTYETFLEFDPAALTFLPAAPLALQEGPYMTEACGNTFHQFETQTATLHITHSILCLNQFLVTGGDVYVVRFRAVAPGTTTVHFGTTRFLRGVNVANLGSTTDATIEVTGTTDVEELPTARLALQVAPNPFNPTTVITVVAPEAGFQRVLVHDAGGRLVDVLQAGQFDAGTRRVVWSAAPAGRRLVSGIYLVTLETAHGRRSQRAVLVR